MTYLGLPRKYSHVSETNSILVTHADHLLSFAQMAFNQGCINLQIPIFQSAEKGTMKGKGKGKKSERARGKREDKR